MQCQRCSRCTVQKMMVIETAETEHALSPSHRWVCLVHIMKSTQLTVLASSDCIIEVYFIMRLLCKVNYLYKCMRFCLAVPPIFFSSSIASAVYGSSFDCVCITHKTCLLFQYTISHYMLAQLR